jgi:hypothetical protein
MTGTFFYKTNRKSEQRLQTDVGKIQFRLGQTLRLT